MGIDGPLSPSMLKREIEHKITLAERVKYDSFGFWLVLFLGLLSIDQVAKYVAQQSLESIFRNYNFAFSIPLPVSIMFLLYAIVLIVVVAVMYRSWPILPLASRLGWVLILAGGVSNIGERIVLGYVRDFIPIANGIFNVADLYIIFGLVLTILVSRR